MSKTNILSILFIILFLNGCSSEYCGSVWNGLTSTALHRYMREEWYINPNNPNSKMLGSSTADYGMSAQKKKHNYIIKYFTQDCKEIPKEKIFKTNAKSISEQEVDKYWAARKNTEYYDENYHYEKIYFYEKVSGEYIKSDEVECNRLPVLECYSDGFCKVYAIGQKNYYIEKKYLYQ